jgi:hypothetical protein
MSLVRSERQALAGSVELFLVRSGGHGGQASEDESRDPGVRNCIPLAKETDYLVPPELSMPISIAGALSVPRNLKTVRPSIDSSRAAGWF